MRKITGIFISCLIAIFFLEILLRSLNPILGVSYMLDIGRFRQLYEYETIDGQGMHFLKPNTSARIGGIEYKSNNYGLRGDDLPALKSEGEKRIIFLGDSHVFGQGVAEKETFPILIENILNEDDENQFRVLSLAVPGFNPEEEYALLRKTGDLLKPDGLVLFINATDTNLHRDPPGQQVENSVAQRFVTRLAVSRFRNTYTVALFLFLREKFFPTPAVKDEKLLTEFMGKMKGWSEEKKIPFIVFTFDSMPFASDYSKAERIPFFDLNIGLENKRRFRLSLVDVHINKEGHLWTAKRVFELLPKAEWRTIF